MAEVIDLSVTGKFYVYALKRGDTKEIFYVGKGQGKRYLEHALYKNRKRHTGRIIAAHGVEYEFIHTGLSEEVALVYERIYIADIGREDLGQGPLVNHTDGGEGISGYIAPPEVRARRCAVMASPDVGAKLSLSQRARWEDPEEHAKQSATLLKYYEDPAARARNSAVISAIWDQKAADYTPEQIAAREARQAFWASLDPTDADARRARYNARHIAQKRAKRAAETPEERDARHAAHNARVRARRAARLAA